MAAMSPRCRLVTSARACRPECVAARECQWLPFVAPSRAASGSTATAATPPSASAASAAAAQSSAEVASPRPYASVWLPPYGGVRRSAMHVHHVHETRHRSRGGGPALGDRRARAAQQAAGRRDGSGRGRPGADALPEVVSSMRTPSRGARECPLPALWASTIFDDPPRWVSALLAVREAMVGWWVRGRAARRRRTARGDEACGRPHLTRPWCRRARAWPHPLVRRTTGARAYSRLPQPPPRQVAATAATRYRASPFAPNACADLRPGCRCLIRRDRVVWAPVPHRCGTGSEACP